jgi:flagella basal body P-ring formation protein FlgA
VKKLLFVVALALARDAAAATVTLRGESVVAGAYFTLGEIASVQEADETLARDLRELRVGRSPRVASALSFRRAQVEAAILRLRPRLRGALEVNGAAGVTVRRGPLQTLALRDVRRVAAQALQAALAERYARFELEAGADETPATGVPAGLLEMHARLPALVPAPRRAVVWIDVAVDGRAYQSIPVAFGVRAFAPVLLARRSLRAGEHLRAADFEPREAQVAGYAAAPVGMQQTLDGLRLKRPLAAGEPLTRGSVALAPVVARDDEVRVRLAVGAIRVETKALATKDGAAGDVIRVRSGAAHATYPVRVTGPGLVEALWR